MITGFFNVLSLALFFFLPQGVLAQAYPKQPINLIIPLAPGDSTDVAGRTIGEGLSKLLKVPVVAVNRPGAGGTIGTDSAVKAAKDGYTIVITNNASVVFNRILTPNAVPYDPSGRYGGSWVGRSFYRRDRQLPHQSRADDDTV